MNKEELYQLSFQLILHSGNARSFAMEAIQDAKKKDFAEAKKKITESEAELSEAHKIQTKLLHLEAGGDQFMIPIILIHAQDHLMNAMTLKDLAVEIIDLRQEFMQQTTRKGSVE
ncbi:PTS lactose/cellobiose transporter subunit IIA [Niallia circulans]|uniref:PTS lactose/cellobiose transporter subunit IIA n=1 Tax=Niallia circulans TaxID=1397 RepID=UPI00352350CB